MTVAFERVDLRQDTQEWLDWRTDGVGASDVLVTKGKSAYKTRWALWAEKVGIKMPDNLSANPNVRRGKYFEPLVRQVVESKFNEKLEVFCGADVNHPWRKVSFDGVIAGQNIPVEIKCPHGSVTGLESTEALKSMQEDRYLDLITNGYHSKLFAEYEDQLQYQIGMLDAPYGYLVFYFAHNNQLKIFKVLRDDIKVKEAFSSVDEFYLNHIKPAVAPEKDPERDYYEPSESELLTWDRQTLDLFEYLEIERKLTKQLKEVKAKKSETIEQLMSMAGNFKMLALHGIKITAVKGRETIQYKDYLADNEIVLSEEEIEKYTKTSKPSNRISVVRNKQVLDDIKNDVIAHQIEVAHSLFMDIDEEERQALLNRSDEADEEYYYD